VSCHLDSAGEVNGSRHAAHCLCCRGPPWQPRQLGTALYPQVMQIFADSTINRKPPTPCLFIPQSCHCEQRSDAATSIRNRNGPYAGARPSGLLCHSRQGPALAPRSSRGQALIGGGNPSFQPATRKYRTPLIPGSQFSINEDAKHGRNDDENQSPVGSYCQHNSPRCVNLGTRLGITVRSGIPGGTYAADRSILCFPCLVVYGV
jgi:hypothetical protein